MATIYIFMDGEQILGVSADGEWQKYEIVTPADDLFELLVQEANKE